MWLTDFVRVSWLLYFIIGFDVSTSQECECGCPDGWITYDGSCYLFGHGVGMTFVEAEHFCQQHHAVLVHINNADENVFVKDYAARLGGARYYHGLTDENIEGIWKWYDNDERATFFDWGSAEPNGEVDRGNEDCVVFLSALKYQWADVPCSEQNQLVCEIRKVHSSEIVG